MSKANGVRHTHSRTHTRAHKHTYVTVVAFPLQRYFRVGASVLLYSTLPVLFDIWCTAHDKHVHNADVP